MKINTSREISSFIYSQETENVDKMYYLGNILDTNGKIEEDAICYRMFGSRTSYYNERGNIKQKCEDCDDVHTYRKLGR